MIGLTRPAGLRRVGVLGMNARNHAFIQRYNKRALYPRVDDKLQTKMLAHRFGIPVPDLVGAVRCQVEVARLHRLLGDLPDFVIKPTRGSGGKGILVITARDGDAYVKPSGVQLSRVDINRHVSNTLSGLYSLGGRPDAAMIERLIQFSDAFQGFSFHGVPDVRIIVFLGYPVMAMTRLSTDASDGRANLHQGAVGVGLDIVDGRALYAVQHNRRIEVHPDTGRAFAELVVPRWDEHLITAARCYEMTRLGYFGADIVLDREKGPLVLELNARPGLSIQTANGLGLLPRLQRVEQLEQEPLPTPEQRVAWSLANFRG